jgi:nucleoside-diphosphate-sugar epimerase
MRVLVLGATGFIGSWAVRALVPRAEVIALTRPAGAAWRIADLPGVELRTAGEDEWAGEIAGIRPDVIVSLDWAGVAGAHRDDDAQWANLDRQRLVLEAGAAAGVSRYVGVGSQAEYGPRDDCIQETAEPHPVTEYGRAKLAASEASRAFCADAGIQWVWARVFSTYGPLDHGHWLLPQIADALLAGRDVELSPGTQAWSYLYGADAGEAMAMLATAAGAGGVVNVGHPDAPVLRETIERFAAHLPRGGELLFGAIPLGPQAVRRLQPDTGRLEALGWAPATTLEAGLELTATWLAGGSVPDPARTGSDLPSPH